MKPFPGSLFAVAIIVSLCTVASAQKAEIFGGYSYMHLGGSGFSANGWNGALTGKFNKFFGITTEVAGVYHTTKVVYPCINFAPPCPEHTRTDGVYTIMFGPQIALPAGKTNIFARALLGGAHGTDSTGFATGFGGGVDFKVGPVVSVRVAQLDFVHTRLFASTQNNFRYAGGLVLRF